MAINAKLELRQTQSLVMTPQLQQAIKLLQLSNMELSAFVEGELERNPLLERSEGTDAVSPSADANAREGADEKNDGGTDASDTDNWVDLESGGDVSLPSQRRGLFVDDDGGEVVEGPPTGSRDRLVVAALVQFAVSDEHEDAGGAVARLERKRNTDRHGKAVSEGPARHLDAGNQ